MSNQNGGPAGRSIEAALVPQPEVPFKEHVERIRLGGDALDARHDLVPYRVGRIALLSTLAGGLLNISSEVTENAALSYVGVAGMVAGFVTALAVHAKQSVRSKRRAAELREADSVTIDTEYELYRTTDGEIAMHWLGFNDESAIDGMIEAAGLARRHGVAKMIVGGEFLDNNNLTNATTALPGAMHDTQEWIKRQKKLTLTPSDHMKVVQSATPDEWLEYAYTISAEELVRKPSIEAVIKRLRALDSRDPLVQMFDDWKADKAVLTERLRRSSALRLAESLATISVVPVPLKAVHDGSGYMLKHDRRHVQVEIQGDRAVYASEGRYLESRELAAALELDPQKLTAILEHPQSNPMVAKLALTYLLYGECMRPESSPVEDDTPSTNRYFWDLGLQYRVEGRRGLIVGKQENRVIAALLAGMVLGIGTSMIGSKWVDERYEDVAEAARKQVAIEWGMDPETAHIDQIDIEKKLAEWSDTNTAWGNWRKTREALVAPVQRFFDADSAEMVGSDANNVGIGNAGGIQDRVAWRITELSAMDPNGYWWGGTADSVVYTAQGPSLFWSVNPPVISERMPISAFKPEGKYIEVEGQVDASDILTMSEGRPRPSDGEYIRVPVPTNAVLAGATLNDKPVQAVTTGDGMRMIVLADDNKSGKLRYWVAPRPKIEPPSPHWSHRVQYNGDSSVATYSGLMDIWEQYLPGISKLSDPEKRAEHINAYLRRQEYSLDPLAPGWERNAYPTAFTKTVLEGGKLVCNVAAMVQWFAETPPEADLNPNLIGSPTKTAVVGFINSSGKGSRLLTTTEAHMALVDERGRITDSTPPGSIAHQITYEQDSAPKSPLEPWMLIAGVIAMGSIAAYPYRRQMMRAPGQVSAAAKRRRANRAMQALSEIDLTTLQLAGGLAGTFLWDPNQDYDAVYHRVAKASQTPTDKQRAIELLLQPHTHARQVRRGLRRVAPSQTRRALRLAARAARKPKQQTK